jgi:hypothetical protein
MNPTIPKPVICHDHVLGTVPHMAVLLHRAESGHMSEREKYMAFNTAGGFNRSLFLLFSLLLLYREGGQQVFCVGPRLQDMFKATSLDGIPMSEFRMPYDTFYVALPGCQWDTWGGTTHWHKVEGVLVSRIEEDNALLFYIWGQENEHSEGAGDDASFWFRIDLDEMERLDLDMESYIDRTLNDPTRERRMRDDWHMPEVHRYDVAFSENSQSGRQQETVRNVLRVVMNMTLYINSVEPDLSDDPAFHEARKNHLAIKREMARIKKQMKKQKNRKKTRSRQRQVSDLLNRMRKLSTANVVWIGREVEKTYLRTRDTTESGPRRHHWVRGHWRPKVLSTVTLRARAEALYQAAKDRVWDLRSKITKEPDDIDMVAYAAQLEEAARELGEASRNMAEVEAQRDAVNAQPMFQTASGKKRRWVQPYERNKEAEESVPAHHYKM